MYRNLLYLFIMEEIWIDLNRILIQRDTILAISNMGNMKLGSGIIKPIPLRQRIKILNKKYHCSRLLAEHFIPKTEEDIALGRDCVDHITHNPINMNVNDIRNLRWCTIRENCNFEEAKLNYSKGHKGRKPSEEQKDKISNARKGKLHSEETKLKMSEIRKCYWERVKNANKLQ